MVWIAYVIIFSFYRESEKGGTDGHICKGSSGSVDVSGKKTMLQISTRFPGMSFRFST